MDHNELSQQIFLLNMRVSSLENELFLLKKYINIHPKCFKIIIEYQNNIWSLKKIIPNINNEDRKFYICAFEYILRKYNSWIAWTAKFENQPILPHGFSGIFISAGAKIGKNCVIFQNVTIGSNTIKNSYRKGSPTIGNDCYIGTGAKIIGNVVIGNNCRIGANAIVCTDIPDNSVVVMPKPRIIHKENMDNRFYPYTAS